MRITKLLGSCVVVLGLLTAGASPTWATTILAPGSLWEYSQDGGATWATGPAPFGNVYDGDFGYSSGTYWPAYGALQVKTSIDLTGFDLTSIRWDLGVDNGFALSANGNPVAADNAEGYTSRWEYSGSISAADLHSGLNSIFVLLEDHGGATAFDMQITGDRAAVPDVAVTWVLLAGALLGLVGVRRRAAQMA